MAAMHIQEGFILREVGDDHMVVGPDAAGRDGLRRIVRINDSAAFLWRSVAGRDFEVATLAALLEQEYGIDKSVARTDAEHIATAWLRSGIVLP